MERILVIDNEARMCELLRAALESSDVSVDTAYDGEEGLKKFRSENYAVVITDLKMPKLSGLELLEKIKQEAPGTDVILMTAYATAQTAVEAMKKGAYDYLIKPFDMDELRLKVQRLLEKKRLERENLDLRQQLKTRYRFDNIIGLSGKMQDVFRLVEMVSQTNTTVLIRGESGTGKELIAMAIHQNSPRAQHPFVAVNCAAIPENLLESELFGYEKGAFTGADRSKPGRFELAGEGTLFLDEIGDLPLSLQVKLLRVLQNREFERLGGLKPIPMRARIIAATNKDLEKEMREGRFREDLYYRINVFPIFLPPLRERKEDILPLVEYFTKKLNNGQPVPLATETQQILLNYHWPGNVRELENVIERAVILSQGGPIRPEHLPPHLQTSSASPLPLTIPDSGIDLEEVERNLILKALEKARGNKSRAAALLGITRRKLYSMMERLGIKEKAE
jgi:DNA-binding NtrC family response regulator